MRENKQNNRKPCFVHMFASADVADAFGRCEGFPERDIYSLGALDYWPGLGQEFFRRRRRRLRRPQEDQDFMEGNVRTILNNIKI